MFFQYANRVNVETKIIKNKLLENNELYLKLHYIPYLIQKYCFSVGGVKK